MIEEENQNNKNIIENLKKMIQEDIDGKFVSLSSLEKLRLNNTIIECSTSLHKESDNHDE